MFAKHCCGDEKVTNLISDCDSVTLIIQNGKRMRLITYIFICNLSLSSIFRPHYLINGGIFGKKLYWI
jgi:hypothetical protein